MWFFQKGLKTTIMSTELIIEANVSKKVLYKALAFAQNFEAKYSAYKADSLLNKINDNAGLKAVKCSEKEREIFQLSYLAAEQSGGVFDPTIGSLTQGVYGFGKEKRTIPDKQALEKVKKLIDYKKLIINDESVYLQKRGMCLDLGGIGKGYVADKIIALLVNEGATKAFVSVGGEICSLGAEYKFAIKNPFEKSKIAALIKTSKFPLSIATSGDYERFIKSQKYHHILNGTDAKQNHFYTSLTLVKNGIEATELDAITTVIFNTPPHQLQKMSKQYGVTIIAITHMKEILFYSNQKATISSIEFFPLI